MKLFSITLATVCLSLVLGQFFDEDLRREGYIIPKLRGQLHDHGMLKLAKRKECRYNPSDKASSTWTSTTTKSTTKTTKTSKTTKTTTKTTSYSTYSSKTTTTTPSKTTSQSHKPEETAPSKCPQEGEPCQGNTLRCNGYSYAQCNFGRWTLRACSRDKSMVCVEAGASVFCGPSKNYALKGCSGVPK